MHLSGIGVVSLGIFLHHEYEDVVVELLGVIACEGCRFTDELNWELLHNILPTKKKLFKLYINIDWKNIIYEE